MSNLSTKLTWGMGLLAMVWLIGGTACLENNPGVCSADLQAKVASLTAASEALIAASDGLKEEVATACYNIASDLDVPDIEPVPAEITDDYVNTICTAAATAINEQVAAATAVDVIVQGGYCTVDAQAQLDCEAECQIEGECDPGSIETRCDPGYLSVECNGACEADAWCEGSVEFEANCNGQCSGMCKGQCGDVATPAEGQECTGVCNGTCTGECHLAADADLECGASVRCRGGCTTDYQAPRCETTIEEPVCNVDADCNAGCQGQASFEATCTEPEVLVVVTGDVDEDFVSTMTENFPAIYNAFVTYGPTILEQAAAVATAAADVANAAGENALCNFLVTVDTSAALLGSYNAYTSVQVTVDVSVSVGAEVGVE
jgi:hypothetical protein